MRRRKYSRRKYSRRKYSRRKYSRRKYSRRKTNRRKTNRINKEKKNMKGGELSDTDNMCIDDCLRVAQDIYISSLVKYEETKKQIVIIGPGSSPSYYCYCMKHLPYYDEDKVKVLVLPFTYSYKIRCTTPDTEVGKPRHAEEGGDLVINKLDLENGWVTCKSCDKSLQLNGEQRAMITAAFSNAEEVYRTTLMDDPILGSGFFENKEIHIIDYVETGESVAFLKRVFEKIQNTEVHIYPLILMNGEYIGRTYPIYPPRHLIGYINNIDAKSVIHIKYNFPRIVKKYHINLFDPATFNPDNFQNLENNEQIAAINDKLPRYPSET